jgi:hypothetical protein
LYSATIDEPGQKYCGEGRGLGKILVGGQNFFENFIENFTADL